MSAARVTLVAMALAAAACQDPVSPANVNPPAGGDGAPVTAVVGTVRQVSVSVTDARDRPLGGILVSWSVQEGGGSVQVASDTTDEAGEARAAWTLGTVAGTNVLTAGVEELPPVTFTTIGAPDAPAELTVSVGQSQTATVGTAVATAPVVLVRDRFGNPIAGATVAFTVIAGGGTISESEQMTDEAGLASIAWTLGTTAGPNSVRASVAAVQASMLATATPDVPAAVQVHQGDGQQGAPNATLPIDPSVRVADQYDNPVPDVTVTFAVTGGDGTIAEPEQTTNAQGIATAVDWTLGPEFGVNTLSASVTGLAPATITADGNFNIFIEAVHLNQGNQTRGGTLGGVSGRPGLLRVVVRANVANTLTPPVRVRLYENATLLREELIPAPAGGVPADPNLSDLTQTWNLELDGSEVVEGLAVEALVDPDGTITESNPDDNRYPEGSGTVSLDVAPLAPFRIVFFPIHTTVQGTTGSITVNNTATFLQDTRRWIASDSIEPTVRSTYTTGLDMSNGNHWSTLLGELQALRTAESATDEYYHGIIGDFNGIAYGGLAYRPTSSSSTFRSGLSYDRMPFSPGTIAHELGHNLGRLHAPCGGPDGVDPNYPHTGATLGSPGYDILNGGLRHPTTHLDYMSYCTPRWTSDYMYGAIVTWRRGDPYARPAPPVGAGTAGPATTGLLLWGRVHSGGASLSPAFALTARPALPDAGGPNQVRAVAADGAELFRYSFAAVPVADGVDPEESHFAFFVPLGAADIERIARIELATPRGSAARVPAAPAEPAEPVVLVERMAGDGVRVRWQVDRYPMALVRDLVTGRIVAFGRQGDLSLGSVPAERQLEVLVSDGVKSRRARLREEP